MIQLPNDLEERLHAYRNARKEETGKVLHRATAIVELLRKTLSDFEPPKPVTERLSELEKRIEQLERNSTSTQ